MTTRDDPLTVAIEARRLKLEKLARSVISPRVRVESDAYCVLDGGHFAVRDGDRVMQITGDQIENEWSRIVEVLDRLATMRAVSVGPSPARRLVMKHLEIRWDSKRERWEWPSQGRITYQAFAVMLDDVTNQGWELVSCFYEEANGDRVAIFRKENP